MGLAAAIMQILKVIMVHAVVQVLMTNAIQNQDAQCAAHSFRDTTLIFTDPTLQQTTATPTTIYKVRNQ
jgi:hypothetical protein